MSLRTAENRKNINQKACFAVRERNSGKPKGPQRQAEGGGKTLRVLIPERVNNFVNSSKNRC